jgi:selenide,water dikinase
MSDIYAMGGKPLTAMNVVCFPSDKLDLGLLHQILEGALEKIEEAGACMVGGHSVKDDEIKFGLAVTGTIHPDQIITKSGAKPGDRLILTKPIGTGILSTALKASQLDAPSIGKLTDQMAQLNNKSAAIMVSLGAHAASDVTGFGLLGHAAEIALQSQVGLSIEANSVPVIESASRLAKMGLIPGGAEDNKKYRQDMIDVDGVMEDWQIGTLFDPQTSGGLLISAPPGSTEQMVSELLRAGYNETTIIGEVTAQPRCRIRLV